MTKYKQFNLLLGWFSFLVAAVTYLLTIEPTTSLWDCGEFIATAYKLQVGHPPGAPLFMIIARFFSLFASDVTQVAKMVNSLSALASAFTILFLFWSITHLLKKVLIKNDEDYNLGNMIVIFGSGLVGALAYTFSDTFWFSAVEGEVYASSSLFTSIVFWAILKWENEAEQKYANRWIILIAYLMGLSIGVHLLNLLAIPAIVFVYYFKNHELNRNGIVKTSIFTIILLGGVMYGIIPGIVKMASRFELLTVNSFGMPYTSGILIYAVLLLASIVLGIQLTLKQEKNHTKISVIATAAFFLMGIPLIADNLFLAIVITTIVYFLIYKFAVNQHAILNTVLLAFAVIILGYSSYSMIVIRSLANPPVDENDPETVFSLLSYLNREQYGDRPLFYGQYYNAPAVDIKKGNVTYTQIDGKYEITHEKTDYVFDDRFTTLFPRMYSREPQHIDIYKTYGKIKGKPIRVKKGNGEFETLQKPTMAENIRFFISYQVGHMYLRYFMWNFSGRQNDIQADNGILKGNWITGINAFDSKRLGPQDNLPDFWKNQKSRNKYYMLPFLLGILGIFYQYKKNKNDFWVVMLLFFFTGIAIVIYLNQTPMQPRERDYAYAGSFYAYAIWIGLGVAGLTEILKKALKPAMGGTLATALCLVAVPGIMASENWDDHDRSGRYLARDIAANFLNSCAPNAILFTGGDNDTFPLWYAQEVEGIRTDVRVVNLMLLNADWYGDLVKRKAYESEPIPSQLTKDKYLQGNRDMVFVTDRIKEHTDLKIIMNFVANDDPKTKVNTSTGELMDYIPTKLLRLPVDSAKMIENGIVKPKDADKIVSPIEWTLNKRHLTKSSLFVLDILANNNWERPIYFFALGQDGTLGLDQYMQLEGLVYRLVPIKSPGNNYLTYGRIDTDIMYDKLMNVYKWGRMNEDDVYLDHFHQRNLSVVKFRHNFNRLAEALLAENKKDSAIAVLDRCLELGPHKKVPYDMFTITMIKNYFKAGAVKKAEQIFNEFIMITEENLDYYTSLKPEYLSGADYETRVNLQIYNDLSKIARENNIEGAKEISDKVNQYMNTYSQKRGAAK